MAKSTYGVELLWGSSSSNVSKNVDIKDYPDMIGDPNLIDTTTLSDSQQTNILGIKTSSVLPFTVNLETENLSTLKASEGSPLYFKLKLGTIANLTWQGSYALGVPGKGVDNAIELKINVVNSTPVVLNAGT